MYKISTFLRSKAMFIIIETLGGPEYATIVLNEEGENMLFEEEEKAIQYANEQIQDPIVVEI